MPKKSPELTEFVPRDSKLNFEQRILNADYAPTLFESAYFGPYNSDFYDGLNRIGVATHKMSWKSSDDGYYVYPTVIQKSRFIPVLEQLSDEDAYNYAIRTGEFRRFDTADEARAYAEAIDDNTGYKRDWNANIPNGNSFNDWVQQEKEGFAKYGQMYNWIKAIGNMQRGLNND